MEKEVNYCHGIAQLRYQHYKDNETNDQLFNSVFEQFFWSTNGENRYPSYTVNCTTLYDISFAI